MEPCAPSATLRSRRVSCGSGRTVTAGVTGTTFCPPRNAARRPAARRCRRRPWNRRPSSAVGEPRPSSGPIRTCPLRCRARSSARQRRPSPRAGPSRPHPRRLRRCRPGRLRRAVCPAPASRARRSPVARALRSARPTARASDLASAHPRTAFRLRRRPKSTPLERRSSHDGAAASHRAAPGPRGRQRVRHGARDSGTLIARGVAAPRERRAIAARGTGSRARRLVSGGAGPRVHIVG
jgi:hypothetical protein